MSTSWFIGALIVAATSNGAGDLDLTRAVLVTPADLFGPERKAVQCLIEELERRTLVRWTETHAWPGAGETVVAVGPVTGLKPLAGSYADSVTAPQRSEAYLVHAVDDHTVVVAGNDARGVLFGVGRLLREMRMERGAVALPRDLKIESAPACKLRGHQLGYRPKTNSYDGWTVAMWKQYIRDLAVFGTNAVELIPPRSDDAKDSPHFPLPQIEMMKHMSQICADYGLDVWIWYPALDKDYGNLATVEFALKEWGDIFAQLPRVDAVFVPGGDPGHTEPKHMLALLEKQTENLHRTHPKAEMWMSPQGFTKAWMDAFLEIIRTQQPAWLTGIVFGPQNRLRLEELRNALPAQYAIRHYPDITHTVQCQFPVPDWDYALAITEQREPINPRPTQYAHIFKLFNPGTVGFLTYSEGCNDDVNKIVWSSLGWDPDAPVIEILRQYARYFIGPRHADDFAQGILALERDWMGPLLTNQGVLATLAQFQDLEREATPQLKLNWRFQQALYRAYYDAYIYRRLNYETELEQQAMDVLRQGERLGAGLAADQAELVLDRAVLEPVAQDLRARVFELAEALYQSIRMQLSVPRYQAIGTDRGANLDLIDLPLNNRIWLKARLAEIRKLKDEHQRLQAIDGLVNWTNPGPGGFYDDLGSLTQQAHLVRNTEGYPDPEFKAEPVMGREYEPAFRTSWNRYAETRYESPLRLHYDNLDSHAQYKVRAVYAGDSFERKMRLTANDVEIHPFIPKPFPPKPLEFDLPAEVTAAGQVTLSWTQEPGRGGNGRGCQVAEVWLEKKE